MPRRKDAKTGRVDDVAVPPEEEAAAVRRALAQRADLPLNILAYSSRPGRRVCQHCKEEFFSLDVERLRICPACKQSHPGGGPREISIKSLGLPQADLGE